MKKLIISLSILAAAFTASAQQDEPQSDFIASPVPPAVSITEDEDEKVCQCGCEQPGCECESEDYSEYDLYDIATSIPYYVDVDDDDELREWVLEYYGLDCDSEQLATIAYIYREYYDDEEEDDDDDGFDIMEYLPDYITTRGELEDWIRMQVEYELDDEEVSEIADMLARYYDFDETSRGWNRRRALNREYEAYGRPKFLWDLTVDMWFDNREYKSDYADDMTLFGMMATPMLGVGWGKGNALMAGTNVTVDFGDRKYRRDPELILYYNYRDMQYSATAGIFPRKMVIGDYPTLFFSDSVRYYDSNLDGALFQLYGDRGYVELAADWLNMISDSEREKFVIFSSGRIATRNHRFFAGYYASMFHHSVSHTEDGVVDNLLAYPYLGFNISSGGNNPFGYISHLKTDSKRKHWMVNLTAGWVQAAQRDRINENKWKTPGGFQARLRAEWRSLGIDNTLYLGDNLMPLYDRYGPGLYQGDSFYRTEHDIYNRLEAYWAPLQTHDKQLKVGAVFHYDGKKWHSQQLVTFSISLNEYSLRGY